MASGLSPRVASTHVPDGASADAYEHGKRPAVEGRPSNQLDIGGVQLGRFTAPLVLCVRDRLKVSGVYARGLSAEMIELEASRDRPDELLVGGSMGEQNLPAEVHPAIALGILRATSPDPAWGRVASVLLTPKVGGEFAAHPRIHDVAADEPHRVAAQVAETAVCLSRDGSGLAAPALTDPAGVRRIGQPAHGRIITYAEDGG